jgi:hypothetical protein
MLSGVSAFQGGVSGLDDSFLQKWTWLNGPWRPLLVAKLLITCHDRIIREATAKSKDGRIDQSDFLNHAAANSRYSLFTPMEASIIFHFAGRGVGAQRLAVIDFAQLLDPRWRSPHEDQEVKPTTTRASFLQGFLSSCYNFVQGGECHVGQ